MADDIDAELEALAGDASDNDALEPVGSRSGSITPRSSRSRSRSRSATPRSPPRSPKMSTQRASSPQKKGVARSRRAEVEEEGEISGAESMGSGAMSESDAESDAPAARSGPADLDDDDIPFPVEGKFHSARDKAEIMNLPEIQREQILAERAAEAERQAQAAQLRNLIKSREAKSSDQKKRKAGTADLDDSPRKSSRAKAKTSESLEAYKKQRKQMNDARERGDQLRARRGKPDRRRSSSQEEGEESDLEYDERDAPAVQREETPPTLVDFQRIKISRSNFAQYWAYPNFNERMAGCFVRLLTGKDQGQPVYRMAQIKRFEEGRPYTLDGPNGRKIVTPVHVITTQGKQEKTHDFSRCSDGRLTESEFEKYQQSLKDDNLKLPTKKFIGARIDDINAVINHRFTKAELEEKIRRTGVQERKFAGEKQNILRQQRQTAVDQGDEAAIARIDQQLASLLKPTVVSGLNSSPAKAATQTQQDRLAALNRANRAANIENIRKAQQEERRAERKHAAAVARGEASADPFARVKIATKTYHDSDDGKTKSGKDADDLFGDSGTDRSRANTPKPPSSTPGKKSKRLMDDDIISSMDMGIDIEI